MRLNEVLDKPVSYEWTVNDRNIKEADFILDDGTEYSATFDLVDPEKALNRPAGTQAWSVAFEITQHPDVDVESGEGEVEITGTGGEFQVFATVKAITEDFVKSVKPDIIFFSAMQPSRAKLYDRFAKIMKAQGWGANVRTKTIEDFSYKEYEFIRPGSKITP